MALNPEVIEHLAHNKDFAAFVGELFAIREQHIAELRDAPTEKLQHLAGRISEMDDILAIANYESLAKKWFDVLT